MILADWLIVAAVAVVVTLTVLIARRHPTIPPER